jgi:hypothetical protein
MGLSAVKMIRGRCGKAALGAIGVVLLAAVPALGLTALGTDFFPAGQADEGPAVSNGPLTFDAPTVTLRKVRPQEVLGDRSAAEPDDAAVVLADWKFTAGFPNTTSFQVLAADIVQLFQKNPLLFLAVAPLIPQLDNAIQGFLKSLTPQEKFLLVALFYYLLSHNPGAPSAAPTPVSPSH